MTGKEMIIYILENDLEDEEIIDKEGKPIWLITVEEAAAKLNMGVATIIAMAEMQMVKSVKLGDRMYIFRDCEIISA